MENPTYKKLVAMLAASVTGNDKMRHHVIKAMQEQVVPAIARLTKPQLVEALAEAVWCIHSMETELHAYAGTDGMIETKHREILSWTLTAARQEKELKVAAAEADAIKVATKANLAKGPPAAAKTRTEEKDKRQSVLVKAIRDMFAKPESPGHHMTNKEILNFLLKNGNPYNYTENVIFAKVKNIAAECRKKARNEALVQCMS